MTSRLTRFAFSRRKGSAVVQIERSIRLSGSKKPIKHIETWTVQPDGITRFDNEVLLTGEEFYDLPRIGVRWDFAAGFEDLSYFGRGPWENYADRKSSALLGHYETTVANTYVDYVMPQEHGHRVDVRKVRLTSAEMGVFVEFHGAPQLEFNATHYPAEDLFAARHTTDLKPRSETTLYLDAAHRGLGTNSCGPDVLPRYRIPSGTHRFSWVIMAGKAGKPN
jgi:beta-galactosidase